MGLSLALVGCGAMGAALLKGWLTAPDSHFNFDTFWVIAPHQENVQPFQEDPRVVWSPSPESLPASPDVIVFAVKPAVLEGILPLYQSFASLIVSVAAGKSLAFYETFFSASHPIARAMPNLPVAIHQGVIGLFPNAALTPKHKKTLQQCFSTLGFCAGVHSDEDINKITAISGSGPAYVYAMIESLAQAANALGFDKELSANLALHTFLGASAYAYDSGDSPTHLRKQVTSPQGTTAAALNVLERGGLHTLIEKTVKAAYHRARELSE